MKSIVWVYFFTIISLQVFSQAYHPKIFYNGIDTFFIGDDKSKYINTKGSGDFFLSQVDTVKGEIISYYQYNKDSAIAYKIDTISFRYRTLTFNGSLLATIDFFKLYRVKDYENAVAYVEDKMDYLKKYISEQLHKKEKIKKLITTNTYRHYGYEWKKGITLSI
jgi:hypothetical protein